MPQTAQEIAAIGEMIAGTAETWIDTPFREQGRVKGKGCDCKGLIAGVATECARPEGQSLFAHAADYGAVIDAVRLKAGLAQLFDRVPAGAAARQAGDVLLVVTDGKPQHLAICAPRPGKPTRVIEAMYRGPNRVRPFRRADSEVDSVWRWRNG